MNYHGKLYGKVGNKYAELGVGTEYVDSLKDKIDALEEQTTKDKADKDRLAKDLKGCFDYYNLIANSKTSNYGQKANYLNKAAIIKRTLSECGYNI